jgi:prepilin-type processing-associated H-X9-DG protein
MAGLGPDAPVLPSGHPRCGLFGYDRATKPAEITDGLATTMAVIETTSTNGPWIAGGPATLRSVDPARQPYIGRGCQFGGLHRTRVNVLFVDGSVRALSETIEPSVFEALSTIAGSEELPAEWDR